MFKFIDPTEALTLFPMHILFNKTFQYMITCSTYGGNRLLATAHCQIYWEWAGNKCCLGGGKYHFLKQVKQYPTSGFLRNDLPFRINFLLKQIILLKSNFRQDKQVLGLPSLSLEYMGVY